MVMLQNDLKAEMGHQTVYACMPTASRGVDICCRPAAGLEEEQRMELQPPAVRKKHPV
jgi:hypothetical protein